MGFVVAMPLGPMTACDPDVPRKRATFVLQRSRFLTPDIAALNFIREREIDGSRRVMELRGRWIHSNIPLPRTFRVTLRSVDDDENGGDKVFYHCVPVPEDASRFGLVGCEIQLVFDRRRRINYGYRIWPYSESRQVSYVD
jgi:hypothetical protein